MDKVKLDELIALFKKEIFDRSSEIDPSDEQDWFSLGIGWAIAKGLSPDEAWSFSGLAQDYVTVWVDEVRP